MTRPSTTRPFTLRLAPQDVDTLLAAIRLGADTSGIFAHILEEAGLGQDLPPGDLPPGAAIDVNGWTMDEILIQRGHDLEDFKS